MPNNTYDDVTLTGIDEFGQFCNSKIFQMQRLCKFLNYISITEAKGLEAVLFAYEVQKWFGQGKFLTEIKEAQKRSLKRFNIVRKKFKQLMTLASNEIYACTRTDNDDQFSWNREYEKSDSYIELKDYYQKYIIQEAVYLVNISILTHAPMIALG